jgi:hypothetical protein
MILNDKNTKSQFKEAVKKFNYNYNYLHDGKAVKRIFNILTKNETNKIFVKNFEDATF